MQRLFTGASWLAVGFTGTLGLFTPARADDTEVFRYTPPPGTRANVLLVIDDSLSMGAAVLTQPAYDPAVTYASQGCDVTRVYWKAGTGSPPSCATDDWFDANALQCEKATQAFAATGRFSGSHMRQYDPAGTGTWRDLASSEKDRFVECHDDRSVHGDIVTLYSGNYLNWYYGPTELRSRLDVVQNVVDDLLETLDGVNVGLMHFNEPSGAAAGSDGGSVSVAMADIATNRTALRNAVAALTPNASSPLAETLYEARQYFAGNAVTFGASSVSGSRVAGDTGFYDSPVDEPCQASFVVLLTDGEPTWDNEADAAILSMRDADNADLRTVTGSAVCDVDTWPGVDFAAPPSAELSHCLDDVAHFLYEGDISSAHADKQRVRTVTVGFAVDLPILEEAAERGNGRAPGDGAGVYFVANDAASLATAFAEIVGGIQQTTASFTAPAVAVNAFNFAENSSDLFVGVFRPSQNFHWPGNLKKYRLRDDGVMVDSQLPGVPAVDPDTGLFVDGTRSYWSTTFDGLDVEAGGAANVIPAARQVYTNLSGTDLNAASNRVSIANMGLTDALLGTPTSGWLRNDVINFINGLSPADLAQRRQMGDPLHSQPVSVSYGPGLRDGLVFVATNDGYLHALDAATGVEEWAFVPQEFLGDQLELLENDELAGKHYGIDGPIRVQVVADEDGIIEPGEKVYLFVGMRRGGHFYYGLDISVRNDPQLLWRRDGTTFVGLGESWSPPVPARVNIGGATYDAFVVGGGYEADQDDDAPSTDTTGNSIYIVESATGNVLWRGSKNGATTSFAAAGRAMDYAIPGEIRVLDLNGDRLLDRLYAADLGGQVWRFDVTNGATAANLVAGGVIAQLGTAGDATPTLAENRRFYYAPDVAFVNTRLESFTHIGIGSGHREHPLGMVNSDRFYALRDKTVAPMNQSEFDALAIIDDSALRPITAPNTTMSATDAGWRLDLTPGEKVLAEARTIANEVFFTTFRSAGVPGTCQPPQGLSRLYRMSVFNGAPVANLDGGLATEPLSMSDLFVENGVSMPSTSQVVFVSRDGDGDGIPDDQDPDDDNDTVVDGSDNDADNDGILDDLDGDIDGDGISNADETAGDRGWVCTDRICVPLKFTNSPVRTYWKETTLD